MITIEKDGELIELDIGDKAVVNGEVVDVSSISANSRTISLEFFEEVK